MDWESLLRALEKCFPYIQGGSFEYEISSQNLIKQEPIGAEMYFSEVNNEGENKYAELLHAFQKAQQ